MVNPRNVAHISEGHQSPKGFRQSKFNSIEISGDLHYCSSHNFVFDENEENRKLHYAMPCYYTDHRYVSGIHNYYGNCRIFWGRFSPISLKSCIRRTMKCRNIPVGTFVKFGTSWQYRHNPRIDTAYLFKVKRANEFDPQYRVNAPSFYNNFLTCERSKSLVEALRKEGFLVAVHNHNVSYVLTMINQAARITNRSGVDELIEGEYAIAYGFGKRIGISSNDSSFMGYYDGKHNILWDKWDEFDKWSKCYHIKKTTDIEFIINLLKTPNDEINQ